METRYYQEENR